MSVAKIREQGAKLIREAKKLDDAGIYEAAKAKYIKGAELLLKVKKYSDKGVMGVRDRRMSDLLTQKISGYLARAETLDEIIRNPPKKEADPSTSDASNPTPVTKKRELTDEDLFNEGIDVISTAIEKDKNEKNYIEAYPLYMDGIEKLMRSAKLCKSQNLKAQILDKVRHHMHRAEELKAIIAGMRNVTFASNKEEIALLQAHREQERKQVERYRQLFPKSTPVYAQGGGDCMICYADPATVGFTQSCEHFFCADCTKATLENIMEQGQFPALCPGCRAESSDNPPIENGVIAFFVNEGIIDMDFALRFHNQQKRKIQEAEAERAIRESSKPCPNCGTAITHYYKHGCHHIMPGSGCPACGHHFCYLCLGPHPCRQRPRCPVFCNDSCGCPICPDCRPGVPCANCDSGGCPACNVR